MRAGIRELLHSFIIATPLPKSYFSEGETETQKKQTYINQLNSLVKQLFCFCEFLRYSLTHLINGHSQSSCMGIQPNPIIGSYSPNYCLNARLLSSCLHLQLFTISCKVELLDDIVKEVRCHDFSMFRSQVTSLSLQRCDWCMLEKSDKLQKAMYFKRQLLWVC